MRHSGIVIAACMLACPAFAAAQGYTAAQGYAEDQGEHSVIRPAGYGWRNQVVVPDGPCGYPMPVRADCYNVCRPCGLRPLCFIKRVARTLDCLLPCNLCCHGGCYGGGPLHGCVLGNRWGCNACSGGCCPNPAGSCFDDVCCSRGPSCGCQSCTSSVPSLSDPFQDDPLPPKPMPNPAREVRRMPTPSRSVMAPAQRTAVARPASTGSSRPSSTAAPRSSSPYKITTDAVRANAGATRPARPGQQSVLRQTSHDRALAEPAPHWIDQAQARPIIRSQSPPETPADLEIPYNPLRAR